MRVEPVHEKQKSKETNKLFKKISTFLEDKDKYERNLNEFF